MPYLITPSELADELADIFGVYGAHDKECGLDPENPLERVDSTTMKGILKAKPCRVCWVELVTARIRDSVANEKRLEKQ